MGFSERAKLTALAIVHIFETSKPFGDYAACVVLRDGAGISYGINQFTHRSGALAAVVERYISKGWRVRKTFPVLDSYLPQLKDTSVRSVAKLSASEELKLDLRVAARLDDMKAAQHEIAFENYLRPAIEACEGSDFTLPLSLAAIYDSINHGSYALIRDRVQQLLPASITPVEYEKEWITEYVKKRDHWLENHPKKILRATDYRTDFFLAQIARGNWNLDLPLTVHGVRLTEQQLQAGILRSDSRPNKTNSAVEQPADVLPDKNPVVVPPESATKPTAVDARPPSEEEGEKARKGEGVMEKIEQAGRVVEAVGKPIDAAVEIGNAIRRRSDSVKSLWTTLLSTVWQAVWAVIAFLIGLPIEVWLVVAVIAAGFGLYYLYRQISLGKLREKQLFER